MTDEQPDIVPQTRAEQTKEALTKKITYNRDEFSKLSDELLQLNKEVEKAQANLKRKELALKEVIFNEKDENDKPKFSNQTKRDAELEKRKAESSEYQDQENYYQACIDKKKDLDNEIEKIKFSQRAAFKHIDYEIAMLEAGKN